MKNVVKVINVALFLLLSILNIVFILEYGTNTDTILLTFAIVICLLVFLLGLIIPNKISVFIYRIGVRLFQKSSSIQIPVESEAKRIFKRRVWYWLVIVNFLMVMLLVSIFIS